MKTLLILALTLTSVIMSKKGIVKHPPTQQPPTQTPTNCFGSGCLIVANCRYYQISPNLKNYQCAACNAGFTLKTDVPGARCVSGNAIANCVQTFFFQGQSFCFECAAGYALSADQTSCILPTTPPNVTNCLTYVLDSAGNASCLICQPTFTLNTAGTCDVGCTLANCVSCVKVTGSTNTFCYNCATGFIGILDPNQFLFSECISCTEYSNRLLGTD